MLLAISSGRTSAAPAMNDDMMTPGSKLSTLLYSMAGVMRPRVCARHFVYDGAAVWQGRAPPPGVSMATVDLRVANWKTNQCRRRENLAAVSSEDMLGGAGHEPTT